MIHKDEKDDAKFTATRSHSLNNLLFCKRMQEKFGTGRGSAGINKHRHVKIQF